MTAASIPEDLKSLWWLPSSPQNKVSGVLHLSQETWPVLELEGRLGDLRTTKDRLPTMLGLTIGGQPLTLLECRLHGFGEHVGWKDGECAWLKHDSYSAEVALLGGHVAPEAGQLVNALTVRFSRLDEWVYGRRSGLRTFEINDALRKSESNRCTVDFGPDAVCTCGVAGAAIKLTCSLHASGFGETGVALRPDVFVNVALEAPMEFLPAWEAYGLELQQLFSLLTGVPIRRQSVFALANSPQGSDEIEVKVIFPVSPPSSGWSSVKWYDMLTEYRDLSPALGHCIEAWLSRDAKTRRAARSFLVARDGTHYLEQRFLELARALEVYYEAEHPSEKLMSQDRFDTLVAELMSIVSSKTDSLIESDIRLGLEGLNRPSLATKLRKLFQTQGTVLPTMASMAESLARDVRKWRVALTHLTGESDNVGENIDRLHDLCDLMELTLETCLLAKIGVPLKVVTDAVKKRLDMRPGLRSLLGLEPAPHEA